MSNHTTYVYPDKFRNDISKIVYTLFQQYQTVSGAFTEDLYPVPKDTLHFIGRLLKPKTPSEHAVCRLIGRAILQVETLSGGSSPVAFVYMLNLMRNLIVSEAWRKTRDTTLVDDYDKIMEDIKEIIQDVYLVPTQEDLDNAAKIICQDDVLAIAVLETLKLASIEGRIYVEDSKQPNYFLERKTGYSFKMKPYKSFLNLALNSWERQNVRVLLVDGLVDKVSEIDQILRGGFEQKEPAIIVARGFSEEVVATLKANFDRGILDIVPVRINSDLESINILSDIASATSSNLVSTLKGEMLCFAQWSDLKVISRIRCMPEQVMVEEPKSRNQVMAQVQSLINKRLDTQLEDVVNLIDERIKSLTSDAVVLRLPNMTDIENQATRVKIDVFLRGAKAILNHNMVRLQDVLQKLKERKSPEPGSMEDCVLRAVETTTQVIGDQKLSCLSAYLAFHVAGKQALMIVSSSGAILSDSEE